MAFGDELADMVAECHAQLSDRTITVRHRAAGAFTVTTGARATTDVDDADVPAVYQSRESSGFGPAGGTIVEHRYNVAAADLSAQPTPGAKVIDGAAARIVSDVEIVAGGKAYILVCRTTKQT